MADLKSIDMDAIMKKVNEFKKTQKRKKGVNFTVDSKGNVIKNYKNGGAVMSGRGGMFKGVR